MRRVHLQRGVGAGDSDGFDFELFGRTEGFFIPFFVTTEECVEFVAFYGFFAGGLRWSGSGPGTGDGCGGVSVMNVQLFITPRIHAPNK